MRLSFRTGLAGANRRRPGMFFSRPQSLQGRLAQLFLQHAVHSRPAPITTHQAFIGRDRGPRPQATALRADAAFKVGMRWDGGGSHRQAGPGREQLFFKVVSSRRTSPPTRGN